MSSKKGNVAGSRKRTRSFSLLTFLLVSGVVALSVAIYSANNDVAEMKAKVKSTMENQGKEMGFLYVPDETMLHVRRLGGYPQMSFAYRYQLPVNKQFNVCIGSGITDPETGLSERVLLNRTLGLDKHEGILVVSLSKMYTPQGVTWSVELLNNQFLERVNCTNSREFDWLQTYLAAFPTDDQLGNGVYRNTPNIAQWHGDIQSFEADELSVIYSKGEFHPSALASAPPELLKNRKTMTIWLEPIEDSLIPASSDLPQGLKIKN